MAASFNRVILLGNLTRDVEMKYTPGGTAVGQMGLAVNDKRKNAAGEWVDEATFVDVTLWGRTAEVAAEYLSKGSPVMIEGRLKLDQWEDKNSGEKRSKLKVVAERLQLIGSKRDASESNSGGYRQGSQGSRQGSQQGQPRSQSSQSYGDEGGSSYSDDDLPF